MEQGTIQYLLRKTPKYIPVFKNYMEKEKVEYYRLERLYNKIIKYKQLFNQIDLKVYDTFEKLSDHIENTIIETRKKNFVKKFVSAKYWDIVVNEETISLFNILKVDLKITNFDRIHDLVIRKIAAYTNPEEFNRAIRQVVADQGDEWNILAIENKILANNAKIAFKGKDFIIADIKKYSSLKALGSPNWCIHRDKSTFKSYLMDENQLPLNKQYIVYNFKLNRSDNKSTVGVTIYPNGNVYTAHYLNDAHCGADELKEFMIGLKPISREDVIEVIKTVKDPHVKDKLIFGFDDVESFIEINSVTQLKKDIKEIINKTIKFGAMEIFKLFYAEYVKDDPKRIKSMLQESRDCCASDPRLNHKLHGFIFSMQKDDSQKKEFEKYLFDFKRRVKEEFFEYGLTNCVRETISNEFETFKTICGENLPVLVSSIANNVNFTTEELSSVIRFSVESPTDKYNTTSIINNIIGNKNFDSLNETVSELINIFTDKSFHECTITLHNLSPDTIDLNQDDNRILVKICRDGDVESLKRIIKNPRVDLNFGNSCLYKFLFKMKTYKEFNDCYLALSTHPRLKNILVLIDNKINNDDQKKYIDRYDWRKANDATKLIEDNKKYGAINHYIDDQMSSGRTVVKRS